MQAQQETAKRSNATRFSPPRDVTGEQINFSGTSERQLSAEGIVDTSERQLSAEGSVARGENTSGAEDPAKPSIQRRRGAGGSLELRKEIHGSLLLHDDDAIRADMRSSGVAAPDGRGQGDEHGRLRRLFLNPSYSLRRQLLLTFGTVSSLTILLVMIVSIVASIATANAIKEKSSDVLEGWVEGIMGTTARSAAEALSPSIIYDNVAELMVQVAQDRFRGYPAADDDSMTPFPDVLSKTNIFPLQNNPLPLDWDFAQTYDGKGNVNATNSAEHLQERPFSSYASNPRLSTVSAMFTMQGACNPRATEGALGYYSNCTEANNDIATGGVVAPSPSNAEIYRKGADLSPFLKAIFEYHQGIRELGYYFSNSGAGSSVNLPHYELDSLSSYESVGCEWMRTPNPIDPKLGPISTEEEIARCHPAGKTVMTREYNPLERSWCRDQALDPGRVITSGPYLNAWDQITWLMSAGRAIYDPVTNHFVACIYIGFSTDGVREIIEKVQAEVDDPGSLMLTRPNGAVVAASNHSDAVGSTVDDFVSETGVSVQIFNDVRNLVNFSEPWNPAEASKQFETTLFDSGEYIISAYPLPPIPEEFDPLYRPQYFVTFSLPKSEGLAARIDYVEQELDDRVHGIIIFAVIVGVAGIVLITFLIFATASWFVEPLKWMHAVGDQVVGTFGETLDTNIDYERKSTSPCLPKTELDPLTEEFSKMVSRFSGEGTAKVIRAKEMEKINLFDLSEEFAGLYQSRNSKDFAFQYSNPEQFEDSSPQRRHLGPNTQQSPTMSSPDAEKANHGYDGKPIKSPLFHWMIGLIVIPTLVITVVISAVVLWQISDKLPGVVAPSQIEYESLRESYRSVLAKLLATKASAATERAAGDNHLLLRFSGWLLFAGMGMSESFTEVIEGAEECKTASNAAACTWKSNKSCDCAWNDFHVRDQEGTCTTYPPGASRYDQKLHFEAQSQDAEPDGAYRSTTFPSVAYSPNSTAWWDDNITLLPQNPEKKNPNTNYGSTYDRVRIVSALSAVMVPIYNYAKSNDKPLGLFLSYEADGMIAGYRGCDYSFSEYAFWKSNTESEIFRPDLCPKNKYGYDARCRGWYDSGMKMWMAGNQTLYITPPYAFAASLVIGQSMTSPLIDPQSNEHIGQVLVDFLPNSIFNALTSDKLELADGGFPIMITPQSDALGHDTVVGPGFSLEQGGIAIKELLQSHFGKYDNEAFDQILEQMRAGGAATAFFFVEDGKREFKIAYAPVYIRSYPPLDSSDISRGVKREIILVYSLALIEPQDEIMKLFQSVNDLSSQTATICTGVLAAIIAISTVLVIYIAFRVTSLMVEPILQLLDALKNINSMCSSEDVIAQLSDYEGSCKEVNSVYATMEMLYKVIEYANAAFFSGDLERAYSVLRDALRLFIRLKNQKGIAVAQNNLGIAMLTMYRTMQAQGDKELCGMSKKDIVQKGSAYFSQSIKLGEVAYDYFYEKQGWSEECLAFMQFLANRYFNRAIFLLTTSCDHDDKKQAESLGFRDLQITADMDVEIVDQCIEMGFKINRVERYELMMGRVRGLLALVDQGYSPDELFLEDHINDVYQDLTKTMKHPSHDLFKVISVSGRMQKLDLELIRFLHQAKLDTTNAARVAIRMLVEDEYVFPDAELGAVTMLLTYMKTADDQDKPEDNNEDILRELELAIGSIESDQLRIIKRRTRTMSSSMKNSSILQSMEGDSEVTLTKRRASAVRETIKGDFTLEGF